MLKEKRSKSPTVRVTLLDAAVLLFHVYKGAEDSDFIGYQDIDHPLHELVRLLGKNKTYKIPVDVIASALWSCSCYNDVKDFWHPTSDEFSDFVDRLLGSDWDYDRFYNLIRPSNKGAQSGETQNPAD